MEDGMKRNLLAAAIGQLLLDHQLKNVEKDDRGYWCVVCGRFLPSDDAGVIVHDNMPHPQEMNFDEEDNPQ